MPILPISTCKDVHLICFLYRACLFYGCLKGQKLSMPEMSLHTYLSYNILIIISILFSLLFVAVVGFLLFFSSLFMLSSSSCTPQVAQLAAKQVSATSPLPLFLHLHFPKGRRGNCGPTNTLSACRLLVRPPH